MVLDIGALPANAGDAWPLRRFVEHARLAQFEPEPDAIPRLRGANTPGERMRLMREAEDP
jgi:hypothetical protein